MNMIYRSMALIVLALLSGCTRRATRESLSEPSVAPPAASLSIAEQFGLAYAPVQIARLRGLLERALPGTKVSWHRLGNTAAIREAMAAGRVDAGFVAIPPFLIGRDNGMDWRIFTGLSEAPLALVTWKEGIRRLADIGPSERIALPQPASVQHILLAMAAERDLGDLRRFDNQIVTMAHPDAAAALLARGDIAAHFASPPYLGRELAEPGMRVVLTGEEAMGGPFTFIVGVASDEVLAGAADEIAVLIQVLAESAAYLADRPDEAAALLAPLYGMPADEIAAELRSEGLRFAPGIHGVERFADFMLRSGFLEQAADPEEDLVWTDPR